MTDEEIQDIWFAYSLILGLSADEPGHDAAIEAATNALARVLLPTPNEV